MPVDPQTLDIVIYPHPALRQRAKPILEITEEVRAVAARMVELTRLEEGIGLAAPQVGLSWRLFVVDVPPNDERSAEATPPTATSGTKFYINPRFIKFEGDLIAHEEGCLSLPEIRGDVLRPPVITITATDLEGHEFTQTGGGLLARCWQHEMDHLDGILIIDKFSQLSRLKNRSAIRDLERGR